MELLKGDIINNAYSELRISGLTVDPTSEDNKLALRKLESLAHEYQARNIDIGYNFENDPDTGSFSGVLPQYENSFSVCLAERLLTDFGKGMTPDPILMKSYSAAASYLMSNTAHINPTTPSSIFPRGSSSTRGWPIYSKYNHKIELAPNSAKTIDMWIDDINDYEEDYQPILKSGEDIGTYTIEVDDGIKIISDSLESPIIKYRIEALNNQTTNTSRAYQRVKIVVTTTDARRITRYINFNVMENN